MRPNLMDTHPKSKPPNFFLTTSLRIWAYILRFLVVRFAWCISWSNTTSTAIITSLTHYMDHTKGACLKINFRALPTFY